MVINENVQQILVGKLFGAIGGKGFCDCIILPVKFKGSLCN